MLLLLQNLVATYSFGSKADFTYKTNCLTKFDKFVLFKYTYTYEKVILYKWVWNHGNRMADVRLPHGRRTTASEPLRGLKFSAAAVEIKTS